MYLEKLKSYDFFAYSRVTPRMLCVLENVQEEDGFLTFYTGEIDICPTCMISFNLNEIKISIEERTKKINIIHISNNDEEQYKIYAYRKAG